MVDAEAGQASDGVSLLQLLQADGTFSCIPRQDILWNTHTHTHTIGIIGWLITQHTASVGKTELQ